MKHETMKLLAGVSAPTSVQWQDTGVSECHLYEANTTPHVRCYEHRLSAYGFKHRVTLLDAIGEPVRGEKGGKIGPFYGYTFEQADLRAAAVMRLLHQQRKTEAA